MGPVVVMRCGRPLLERKVNVVFDNILTLVGSYVFPIAVTIYLLYERSTYIKEQSAVMQELKESITLLNKSVSEMKNMWKEVKGK